jgi:hypothetical protein
MQELANRVWEDPRFRAVADRLRRAWLADEVGIAMTDAPSPEEIAKAVMSAAILACSASPRHRLAAFRTVTSAYELRGASELPLDQAVRVVLARLSNFPAMLTRPGVDASRDALPFGLLAEEMLASDRRTVSIGGKPTVLTDFQHALWSRLRARRRVAMTAPTSAGKSFVLQRFLTASFEEPGARSVMYIVPTRALITQVSRSIRESLADGFPGSSRPEVPTVPIEAAAALPARAVYVLTPERAQILVAAHPGFAADAVVVDEAHLIADGARGVRLQSVLNDLVGRNPAAQLLFASPGTRNLDVFGRLLGIPDVQPLKSREPTVAQNFVNVRVEDSGAGLISLRLVADDGRLLPVGEIRLGRRTATRIEKLANVAAVLGRGATNLVYANGQADAEEVALELVKRLGKRPTTPGRAELARVARESVHRDYALAECALAGVAFHYSNIPTQLRLAVEDAVAAGDVDFLVCTSTLLQGVNLPARNIFMYRPEKGQHAPLRGVDFWNLSGRAGRLLKEFQGNIFLIDYDAWRTKPLSDRRDAAVIPALDGGVMQTGRLLSTIAGSPGSAKDQANFDAVFVSLLGDYRQGGLGATLDRISRDNNIDRPRTDAVRVAISTAAGLIDLPQAVLRRSPDISAHRQQRLYDQLKARAGTASEAAALVLRHPDHEGAYDSYAAALQACHRTLEGLPELSRLHRFHALVCLWWMQGRSLPRIVQNQLDRNTPNDPRPVIRDTLELIEREVRYRCVKLFTCYNTVLAQVLGDLSYHDLAARMPEVPLYLEMGASDRTTISLMSLGISRPTATRLSPFAPSPEMDVASVLAWLSSSPAALSRLTATASAELRSALTMHPLKG